MLVPYCYVYCSFLICLEIGKCDTSNFVPLKLVFAIHSPLKFHTNWNEWMYFFKRYYWDFVGVSLNLSVALGSVISWQFLKIHSLVLVGFWGASGIFSIFMYTITSGMNRDNSRLLFCLDTFCFFLPVCVGRTSRTVLYRERVSMLVLFLILEEVPLPPFSIFVVNSSCVAFIMLRCFFLFLVYWVFLSWMNSHWLFHQ